MIYDCFQFFNELDILDIRLHVLSDIVDRFVISEATETFSGQKKPLYYLENKERFREFEDRIIHVTVEDTPQAGTHQRDEFQKNAVTRGLSGCTDDDIIIFSDLDEIPNPKKIREILADFQEDKIYHFAQRLFYCYLNMEEVSGNLLSYAGEFPGITDKKWIGTKMLSYKMLREHGWKLGELRFPERKELGIRVADGGWHFGYMGGSGESDLSKRIKDKVVAAAHQEYNSRYILSGASDRVLDGKDLFGRDSKMVRVEIDETYPDYIREHQQELSHLILQEEDPESRRRRHMKATLREMNHRIEVAIKRAVKHTLGLNRRKDGTT